MTVDFILAAALCDDGVARDGLNARRAFEEEMNRVGLVLEEDVVDDLVFVKIHVPAKVLRKYCGIMKLRMPIKRVGVIKKNLKKTTRYSHGLPTRVVRFEK